MIFIELKYVTTKKYLANIWKKKNIPSVFSTGKLIFKCDTVVAKAFDSLAAIHVWKWESSSECAAL